MPTCQMHPCFCDADNGLCNAKRVSLTKELLAFSTGAVVSEAYADARAVARDHARLRNTYFQEVLSPSAPRPEMACTSCYRRSAGCVKGLIVNLTGKVRELQGRDCPACSRLQFTRLLRTFRCQDVLLACGRN